MLGYQNRKLRTAERKRTPGRRKGGVGTTRGLRKPKMREGERAEGKKR